MPFRQFVRARTKEMSANTPSPTFMSLQDARVGFSNIRQPNSVGVVWSSRFDNVTTQSLAAATNGWWKTMSSEERTKSCVQNLRDKTVYAYYSWFSGNYGHFLHDHLPTIAWLQSHIWQNEDARLLLPWSAVSENVLRRIDKRIIQRIVWHRDSIMCVRTLNLVIPYSSKARNVQPIYGTHRFSSRFQEQRNNLKNLNGLRTWMTHMDILKSGAISPKYIVFYVRSKEPNIVNHGRFMEQSHINTLLKIIRQSAEMYGLDQKQITYSGTENGHPMSIARQIEIFSNAMTVIGPHGSGLANILWMPSLCHTQTTVSRGQVIEFTGGRRSKGVQNSSYRRTYWSLFGTAPWVEYHIVPFTSNSTGSVTWVDVNEFSMALDATWGRSCTVTRRGQEIEQACNVLNRVGSHDKVTGRQALGERFGRHRRQREQRTAAAACRAGCCAGDKAAWTPAARPTREATPAGRGRSRRMVDSRAVENITFISSATGTSPRSSFLPVFWHIPKAAGTSMEMYESEVLKFQALTSLGTLEQITDLVKMMKHTMQRHELLTIMRKQVEGCIIRQSGRVVKCANTICSVENYCKPAGHGVYARTKMPTRMSRYRSYADVTEHPSYH